MKQKKTNQLFMVNGIKNLLKKNYKIEADIIDIDVEVDSTLTFEENWNLIKQKFIKPTAKEVRSY